jgi:hypothetical protein
MNDYTRQKFFFQNKQIKDIHFNQSYEIKNPHSSIQHYIFFSL